MSERATPEEQLGDLHSKLSDVILEQLKGYDVTDEEGNVIKHVVDPRWAQAAITFLNNNKVIAQPFLNKKKVSEIEKKLQERRAKFHNVNAIDAAKRAAENR